MKIYAISVVKNEADIIAYTLGQASKWADKVIVYDNGSTDETWKIIKSLNQTNIVAYKQDNKPYSDGLRADVFNAFKHEMEDGDWWVIQDSDEVFVDNPRIFIEQQSGYFHHINGKKIDFSFNLNDIETLELDKDFEKNIPFFNYYTPEAWSEPRAIKHRKRLKWEEKKIWPTHIGLVCDNPIRIKHYPLRSLEQIMNRWKTRKEAKERGGQLFDHWSKEDWKSYYSQKMTDLQAVDKNIDPFDIVPFANNYKQGLFKRVIKTILHKTSILP